MSADRLRGMNDAHEPVAAICTTCHNATSWRPTGWINDDEADCAFALIMCSHCRQPIVMRQDYTWGYGPGGTAQPLDDGPPVVVWPTLDAPLSLSIPDDPRRSFEEARGCFRAGQHTASAIMVRRTLEAVCADKGAVGANLRARLDDLKTKSIIEGNLAAWSHDLRVLGNDAAHDTALFISAEDAKDALELAEALLTYVYVLNAKYDAFNGRRSQSPAPAQTAPVL